MIIKYLTINFPTSDLTDSEKEKANEISLDMFGLAEENDDDLDEESELRTVFGNYVIS